MPDFVAAAEEFAKGVRHVAGFVADAISERRNSFSDDEAGDYLRCAGADALAEAFATRTTGVAQCLEHDLPATQCARMPHTEGDEWDDDITRGGDEERDGLADPYLHIRCTSRHPMWPTIKIVCGKQIGHVTDHMGLDGSCWTQSPVATRLAAEPSPIPPGDEGPVSVSPAAHGAPQPSFDIRDTINDAAKGLWSWVNGSEPNAEKVSQIIDDLLFIIGILDRQAEASPQ